MIGALLGALIIGVVNNGLNLLGVESFWQTIIQGVILVAAVAFDALIRGRRRRFRIAVLRRRRDTAEAVP